MDFFKSTNWGYFINAFKHFVTSDDYDIQYKKFNDEILKYDLYDFIKFVIDESFYTKKESLQYILDSFLNVVLLATPKINENLNVYIDSIDYILDKGILFPIHKLFTQNYKDLYISMEEESFNYNLRAKLIDRFYFEIGVEDYIKSIPIESWKDIPEKSPEDVDEEEIFKIISDIDRYSVLKYYSVYLKSL